MFSKWISKLLLSVLLGFAHGGLSFFGGLHLQSGKLNVKLIFRWKLTVYDGCIAVEGDPLSCPANSPAALRAAQGGDDYGSTGIYANMIQIFISLILSIVVLSGLIKRVKYIYALGLAIGGVLMILLKFGPKTVEFAWIVTMSLPVAISVIQAFPFAIIGSYNKGKEVEETGVQMGLLNLFITCKLSIF
jgi:hypothetical protein